MQGKRLSPLYYLSGPSFFRIIFNTKSSLGKNGWEVVASISVLVREWKQEVSRGQRHHPGGRSSKALGEHSGGNSMRAGSW